MRETVADILSRPKVRYFILGVIMFNAVLLGMETSTMITSRIGGLIKILDTLCLIVFIIEIAAKLFAHRLKFFRDGWNVFDFIVVGIALMPAAEAFSVLRALRVLRVLRVLSAAPSLRKVVEGFLRALPGMGSVFLLVSIIFYIASVMATKLFAADFPEWFGSLGLSAYSLFQIMTLESWSMGIVRPVMEVHPHAWAFFVPFILVTTFAVVNLVVGLIVNSMQDAHEEDANDQTDEYRDEVLKRLAAIEAKLSEKS